MSNIAKVAVHWQLNGTLDIFSILHVKSVDSHDPFVEADLQAIALGVDAWWHGGVNGLGPRGAALYVPDVVLYDVEVTRVRPTVSPPYVLPVGFAGTALVDYPTWGDSEVIPLPPQVCWLVGLRTAVNTRRGRGRVYLPATWIRGPFEEPEEINAILARGEVDPRVRDLVGATAGTLASELFEAGSSGEYVWAVFSAVADDSYAVLHFEVADFFCTQRPRAFAPTSHSVYGLSGAPA